MYARGILFGKMKYELGDHSTVKCPESHLMADIEFKTKGWVGGTYNAIGGFIKDTKSDKNLFELSGLWNGEMFIKDLAVGRCFAIPYQSLTQMVRLTLALFRPGRRRCSSMPHMRRRHTLRPDRLINKTSESHKGSGRRSPMPSRPRTRTSQQMRSPGLKICSGKKRRNDHKKVLNGSRSSSGAHTMARAG